MWRLLRSKRARARGGGGGGGAAAAPAGEADESARASRDDAITRDDVFCMMRDMERELTSDATDAAAVLEPTHAAPTGAAAALSSGADL